MKVKRFFSVSQSARKVGEHLTLFSRPILPAFFLSILLAGLSLGSEENNNVQQTLYMVDLHDLNSQATPWFIGYDYALVGVDDVPSGVSHTAILADQPGDYYVMSIESPQDLDPIRNSVPFVIVGSDAFLRADPSQAADLPRYGRGLTRLSPYRKFAGRVAPPASPIIAEYDPDIADMISGITAQTCEERLTDITSFLTRYSYSAHCREAEEYVYNQFTSYGLSASYFDFSWNGTDMHDVIGEMTGTVRPESVIIICGHLDCISEDPYNDAPGAEDNGSGTVTVLEAARILSQYQTDLTVRFITFSGEEQGLIGSDYYAEHMADIGEEIGAVINLDMVAYHGVYPLDMHIYSDPLSHWLGQLAAEAVADYTPVDTIPHYQDSPFYGSDHYSFAIRGYPAMFFIDAEPWYGEDWYPYYHTTDDVMDHLDMDLQADIARAGTALAAILARVDFGTEEIPTLSEWGLVLMGLLLMAGGTAAIAIRKKTVPVRGQ